MAGQVFMATPYRSGWVPAPLTDMAAGGTGYSETLALAGGTSYVSRALGSARKFDMQWMGDPADLELIQTFASGMYGETVYWADPFVAGDRNILPAHWATPGLAATEGSYRPLMSPAVGTMAPNQTNSFAVDNGLVPPIVATYTRPGLAGSLPVGGDYYIAVLAVPPGYTLDIGWRGAATNYELRAYTVIGVRQDLATFRPSWNYSALLETVPGTAITSTNDTRYTKSIPSSRLPANGLVALLWTVPTPASASTLTVGGMYARLRDTERDAMYVYAWTGTANASPSTATKNGVLQRTNDIVDPLFTNANSWYRNPKATYDFAPVGQVRITPTAAITNGELLTYPSGAMAPGQFGSPKIASYRITNVSNMPVTVFGSTRAYGATTSVDSATTPDYTIAAGESYVMQFPPVVPTSESAQGYRPLIRVRGMAVGQTVIVSEAMGETGDGTTGPFFSGASANAGPALTGKHQPGTGTMALKFVNPYVDQTYITAGSQANRVGRRIGMAASLVEVNL